MKEFFQKCKRYLAMFMAVAMLLSSSNIGVFIPVRALGEQDPSVTLGVLIKENIDGLSEEEIEIITSGYLSADKTYSYQMPTDDDDLISIDEKAGIVTAKKYTDPKYGTQWIPVRFNLTNGTSAIAGYEGLPMYASGEDYIGTYELEQNNPGNSFTAEVIYSLDLTMSDEDVAAQQEMLDASYALAQDIALMKYMDAVSVIGDDAELAQKIIDLSGGFIKDPTKIYADTILEFLTMNLEQLGGVSAVDLIYELVEGIKIPYVEEVDFETGEIITSEETLQLGRKGCTAATSLYNQKHSANKNLDLVAFLNKYHDASYLELLVEHGAELEAALTGNYADIDYLSNLNSSGGLKHVSNQVSVLLENFEAVEADVFEQMNSYLESLNKSVNSVQELQALIAELEEMDDTAYAAIDEKLGELDEETKEMLESVGGPEKVENADDMEALKKALVKAYSDVIGAINTAMADMDADAKAELVKAGAPEQITLADTSSYDAFVNSGDQDIADMTALENALKSVRQDLLDQADAQLNADATAKAELVKAGAPEKIEDEEDLAALQTALTKVKSDLLKEADDTLQETYKDATMKQTLMGKGAPEKITTAENLTALRTALVAVQSDLISQTDSALEQMYANKDMKTLLESKNAPKQVTSSEDMAALQTALVAVRKAVLDRALSETNAKLTEMHSTNPMLATVFGIPTRVNTERELNNLVTKLEQVEGTSSTIDEAISALKTAQETLATLDEAAAAVGQAKEAVDTLQTIIDNVDQAIDAVETLEEVEGKLATASNALNTLNEVLSNLQTAKAAVEKVKPYISQVMEAQEQIALLNNTYIPLLKEVESGLIQLEEGMAQLEEKQQQLDMLILVMQAFCQTVEPVNTAFAQDTWKAPSLLNTAANPDYAKLTALADGMTETDHAAKPVLHVTETVVKCKVDMYDVTVEYKAVVIDPTKTDSTDTIDLVTKTYVVTLSKNATPQEILAEIADKVDEDAILSGWAISADNYDRSTTALPETLTENITYTISYAPTLLTVSFGEGYETGTEDAQVPYGYRMTLPKLDDVTGEYTYTVNDQSNLDQGTVVTITEDTHISREEGAVSEKQYLTDLVINTDPDMDEMIKNILQNQALNKGQAISIRVPGKDQVVVTPAQDATATTITALPFGSRIGNKNWIAQTAIIDGVTVNMVDGVHVEINNPGFDKVVVNYQLAITAAALGITDEQLLAAMNIPYELVTDYQFQKEKLDALAHEDIMGLLTQINAQDVILESPELTLKGALGKIEDLNGTLELGLGQGAINAAKRLYNLIPDVGYLALYYTLEQYNEQGMIHYYKNEQTYINQIVELNEIMTALVQDEGFIKLIPEKNMATFEAIQEVLGNAASLAEEEKGVNHTLINVSSPYLNTLLTALDTAANNAELTNYTTAPSALIWTAAIEQPGPSKRTATMTVSFNGAEKSATKTVEFGQTIPYAELTAWAQTLAKELGLSDEISAYYTVTYSFDGDVVAGANVEVTASWELREYTVYVGGEAIGSVNYENRQITLAEHIDSNYQYRYYINNVLYGAGTHTLTLAQFKALTEGNLTIVRETVNLAEEKLIKLVDSMNGAAVLTKDVNGEYAVVLPVDPNAPTQGLVDFAIGLFMTEYKYIGLGGNEFYSGQFHLQALIDTLMNSGIGTESLLNLIDANGNITNKLVLPAGTEVLNTTKPAYVGDLGGVVMESTMNLGADATDTINTKFYLTLAGTRNGLQKVRKGLEKLQQFGVTFNLNEGRANLKMNLPDQAYGAYLAALSMVGEVDIHNINDVNAQIAMGYLLTMIDPMVDDSFTLETLTNTVAKFGRDVDLSKYEGYFNTLKSYYDIDNVIYEDDTCILPLENIGINRVIGKMQAYVDKMEMPEGITIDLSKLIYEYDGPETEDDASAGLDVALAVELTNLSTEYAALFLDIRAEGILNKFGMWTEQQLLAGSSDFSGASVIVLVDDVTGDLNINTTTVLDLNGKTINGNITTGASANLIIIDNAYEQVVPGGVTGTVSGNVSILEGKYASDVSAFLDNGYTQNAEGVVYNKLYNVKTDENKNITVTLNATPSEIRELASKQGLANLAIEMVAGLVINNYNKASLSIENGTIYHISLNDVVGLYANGNKLDTAIDTGLSWISASDLTDLINKVINDLTDFAGLQSALEGDGKIISYTTQTSTWNLEFVRVEDGNYLSMNLGAAEEKDEATLHVVVTGSLQNAFAQLAGALAETVTVDVEANMEDIVRDEDSVIHVIGSFAGTVEIDFTDDPNYIIMMAAILADGADGKLKADLEAGIEAYYEKNSLYALEQCMKAMTVKQICDSLSEHARSETFTSIVNGLNLKAETKATIIDAIGNQEMGYSQVIDAIGIALRQLEARGLLETFTESGRTLGSMENKDSVSNYFGFTRDKIFVGQRHIFRDYELGYELDLSEISVKVRLFLDHVHTYEKIADDQYLKSEATCTELAVYYLSCTVCGKAHDTETFEDTESGYGDHDLFWNNDKTHHWQECSRCDFSTVDEKAKHNFGEIETDHECTVCGFVPEVKYNTTYTDLTDEHITADLEDAGFETAEKITNKLHTVLKDKLTQQNINLLDKNKDEYEVELKYSLDDGNTWIIADKDHFPEDGKIKVSITVPTGVDATKYNFYVIHMFAENAFGKVAGETEEPEVTVNEGKIEFVVTGLSPVMLAWTCNTNHAQTRTVGYVPASCTDGYTGDIYCVNCDELLEVGTVIPGEGHIDEDNDEYCDRCGEDLTPPCQHSYIEDPNRQHLAEQASCTSPAKYYKICEHCGEPSSTETFTYGELKPHDFTAQKAEEQYLKTGATCTEPAVYYKSCTVCGKASETETFTYGELKPHDFTAQKAEEQYLKTGATCTEPAVYYKSCTACGLKHDTETFTYGVAKDHDLRYVAAEPATTTTPGNKAYWYCDTCHKYFSDAAGTNEITQQSTVLVALPTLGTPNLPVGGEVYGFLADTDKNILFVDIIKDGMTVDEFKNLLSAAFTNDADNKVAITVSGAYTRGTTDFICTTAKVTLVVENADGIKATATYDIVVMGDTNCNGRVESGDAVLIDKHYRGLQTLTGLELVAADTNRNGRLESGDAVKIMVKYQNAANYVTALNK